MSTYKICFLGEIRKNVIRISTLIWRYGISVLNFSNNVAVRGSSFFGPGLSRSPIWLDDLTCAGDESKIDDCVYRPWGTNNCGHGEDLSVICNGKSSCNYYM